MKTKLACLLLTAVHLHLATAARAAGDYVAHEWGTFTSVQGADGVQMEWNPLVTSELPSFVYDRARRPFAGSKPVSGFGAKNMAVLQRMETPVIYFYADREMTVDASVKFPQGTITEWFPQIERAHTATNFDEAISGRRAIRWDRVQIFPQRQHAAMAPLLPFDKSGSHYFAARDTEADFLRVSTAGQGTAAGEVEKFLFYRGVGSFRAPLTVTLGSDGNTLNMQNTGDEALSDLFVYSVAGGQGKYTYVERLGARSSKVLPLQTETGLLPLAELRVKIASQMQTALAKQGLYEREAAAMVKTWDDSWFAESGVRVLYTLPRAWTDHVLPLTLAPAPREVARVMVGRAEVITPAMEWELLKQVVRYTDTDERIRARAVEDTRNLGLGRFQEPATRRLTGKIPNQELVQASWALLQAASKPAAESKPLALR